MNTKQLQDSHRYIVGYARQYRHGQQKREAANLLNVAAELRRLYQFANN